jgi:tetratricopeptide (TPR) repeat protein
MTPQYILYLTIVNPLNGLLLINISIFFHSIQSIIFNYKMTLSWEVIIMTALDDLDVTDNMQDNIKIIQSVINGLGVDSKNPSSINADQKQVIGNLLEEIDKKIDEIEDYFWRPLDSPEIYEQLKNLAVAIGRNNKAEKFQTKLNRIEANELEFMGRVENFYGNNTEALKYYEQALELSPDHELASTSRDKASKSLARAKEQLPKLEKKLLDKPGDTKALFKFGQGLLNMNRPDEAIKIFDKLIEREPDNPDAWARRGTSMLSQKKYEESKKYFEKALEIKPTSTTAKRGKNYALYFLGELDAEQLE